MRYFYLIFLLCCALLNAQNHKVGINTTAPVATLEIKKNSSASSSEVQGVLFPQLTTNEINAMQNVPEGLMVYDTDKKCLSIFGKRSPTDAVLQWSCLYQTSTSSGSSGFVNVLQLKPEFPRDYSAASPSGLDDIFDITDIQETSDGGYFVLSSRGYMGSASMVFLKLNNKGYVEWQRMFSGYDSSYPYQSESGNTNNFVETNDGYIIAGTKIMSQDVNTSYTNVDEYELYKIDKFGNSVWFKNLPFPYTTSPYTYQLTEVNSLAKHPDGNYVITGNIRRRDNTSPTIPYYRYFGYVAKIDASGNVVWSKMQGGGTVDAVDKFNSVKVASDGSVYVVGKLYSNTGSYSSNQGNSDMWALKYDTNGNLLWEKTLGTAQFDFLSDLAIASDGNSIICSGFYLGDTEIEGYPRLVRFDVNNGNVLWQGDYLSPNVKQNATYEFHFHSTINSTADGGFALLDRSGFAYKLTSSLGVQWKNSINCKAPGNFRQLSSGGYIAIDYLKNYVVKMNSAGQQVPE